jgi:hypothetical protein
MGEKRKPGLEMIKIKDIIISCVDQQLFFKKKHYQGSQAVEQYCFWEEALRLMKHFGKKALSRNSQFRNWEEVLSKRNMMGRFLLITKLLLQGFLPIHNCYRCYCPLSLLLSSIDIGLVRRRKWNKTKMNQ